MCKNIHHLRTQGHWELEDVPVVPGWEVGALDRFQLHHRTHTHNEERLRARPPTCTSKPEPERNPRGASTHRTVEQQFVHVAAVIDERS